MQTMMLKPKKFLMPVITPFAEDEYAGPLALARIVADEYRVMEDGHHAQLRAFLGRAYRVYRLFQQAPDSYEKLKQDPFWEKSRQKPKDLTTSKWVLLFLMRAETRNARTRASTFAKILNGFARQKARDDQVPKRIAALGGVEDAYDHFLAVERGLKSGGHARNEATDNHRPLIPRKDALRAARGAKDDQVQSDVEAESTSENGHGIAIGGRRHVPLFDPERHLLVEHEPEALKAILAGGTARGACVRVPLTVIVYPRDATGFVRVVREQEPSGLPEDFLPIDYEDGPSERSLPSKRSLRSSVRPTTKLGKLNRHPSLGRSKPRFAE